MTTRTAGALALLLALAAPEGAICVEEATPAPPAMPARATEPSWKAGDFDAVPARRWCVEVARFPSTALAEGVRQSLANLGWAPLAIVADDMGFAVTLGNFASAGEAQYVALDLAAQRLATAHLRTLPSGAGASALDVTGPLLPPFLPSPGEAKPMGAEDMRRRIEAVARLLPDAERRAAEQHLLAIGTGDASDGIHASAAVELAEMLAAQGAESEVALELAGRVARREWAGSDAAALRAGELVADLLYARARDWRGAWAASSALAKLTRRSASARSLDELRLAALEAELAGQGGDAAPSWGAVRARIRRVWESSPAEADAVRSRAELLFLQTFAWEGLWGRCEEAARAFIAAHGRDFPAGAALARVRLAQSLERKEDYRAAVALLDEVIMSPAAELDGIEAGGVRLDIGAMAREARRRFVELEAGAAPAAPVAK